MVYDSDESPAQKDYYLHVNSKTGWALLQTRSCCATHRRSKEPQTSQLQRLAERALYLSTEGVAPWSPLAMKKCRSYYPCDPFSLWIIQRQFILKTGLYLSHTCVQVEETFISGDFMFRPSSDNNR